MHLKARAWGSLKSQLTVQLFANGQRMFPLGQSPCNLFAHLDRWSCSPSFLLVSPWCVRCRPPPWYSTPRSDSRGGIGGGVGGGECFLVLPMELATMEMVWATTMVGKARGKEEGGRPEGGRREAATASAKSKDYIHHCERRRRSVTRSLARVGQRGAAAAAIRPTRETPRTNAPSLLCSRRLLVVAVRACI